MLWLPGPYLVGSLATEVEVDLSSAFYSYSSLSPCWLLHQDDGLPAQKLIEIDSEVDR